MSIAYLPSTYRPRMADDFVGPAKRNAELISRLVAAAKASDHAPLALMLWGPPGVGKTQLAEFFTRAIGAGPWSIHKFNGTQVKIEEVETLAREFRAPSLFDGYRVIRVEEVDKVPHLAQVRLLTLLDDLPPRAAIVATSNCRPEEFEIRFQRRFTVLHVTPPPLNDVESLLLRLGVPAKAARHIANFSGGNIGQALKDADLASVEHAVA
ncbi:MAG TPA: AAA family ATPase [Verrucomicrobiae bacterium]|nr:AAA family ATPase [Verrucomicrobiae bacterium]